MLEQAFLAWETLPSHEQALLRDQTFPWKEAHLEGRIRNERSWLDWRHRGRVQKKLI
jgi:hypothetical protein